MDGCIMESKLRNDRRNKGNILVYLKTETTL